MLSHLVEGQLIRRIHCGVVRRIFDDVSKHSHWVKPVIFRERFHNRRATCLPQATFGGWMIRRVGSAVSRPFGRRMPIQLPQMIYRKLS